MSRSAPPEEASGSRSRSNHLGAALLRPAVRSDDPEASQEFRQRSRRGAQGGGRRGGKKYLRILLLPASPLPVNFSSGISGQRRRRTGHRGGRRAAPKSFV